MSASAEAARGTQPWIIWGSELSPFALKVALSFRHAGLPHRFLPAQGDWAQNWRVLLRLQALKRGWLPLTWPQVTEDDELPLVPFVFGPRGENLYDSSAIAEWLDRGLPESQRLIPQPPLAAFVAHLIDDYADEFGLYLVHHQRWKVSARDNDAGPRVAREFRFLAGPLQGLMAKGFAARQTRRLPYLFSVAPAGFSIPGLPPVRQPPTRAGFPPTHALLEAAHQRLCAALDTLLQERPYVLGTRFTLADAALYGQLAMNLSDPSTNQAMQQHWPTLHRWLLALHDAAPSGSEAAGPLLVDAALQPLLQEIARIHLPLMRQNAAAHQRHRMAGQRRFNEAAFNAGAAIYDGELDGHPYRSVAKSFQARTWRESLARWSRLPVDAQAQLIALVPEFESLRSDGPPA